ncbi:hypothetical protein [Vibrio phage YC]|uniref:Uncharacterized protein n=1 Tax=Vibrio phage YC TaxID=2267403 RepID=A0A384ZSA6_9CAUD|nr:hypothetical protein HWB64_gp167 [Vibrio phage YC]AXC34536.1 hypothetical protein [Vibrio phage YC]
MANLNHPTKKCRHGSYSTLLKDENGNVRKDRRGNALLSETSIRGNSAMRFGCIDRQITSRVGAGKILLFLARGANIKTAGLYEQFGPVDHLANKHTF